MLCNLLIKPLIYFSKAIGLARLWFYGFNIISASFTVPPMHWSFYLSGVMRMSKMLCDYEESITQGTSHYNVLVRVRLV